MRTSYLLKPRAILLLCLLLPLLLIMGGVFTGSQPFSWLLNTEVGQTVLWQIRLPRALLGFLVGAALAWAGVLIQGIVRNPLADPGLIGVSGGAAVGVALVLWLSSLGLSLPAQAIPLAAAAGAALALLFVLRIGGSQSAFQDMGFLILAGIAVSVMTGAVIGLLAYLSSDQALRQIMYWSMGSLSSASWYWVALIAPVLTVALLLWPKRLQALDALLLGEVEARSLGVNVKRLQWQVVLWTALLVGVAVAACGIIGFVGLVSPHLARLLTGASHKRVLPVAVCLGGTLLVLADMVARTLIAPAEIPIGIITSLIGGPLFISLLLRERRQSV
ncbi:MAG: iron ABC transporter permease [Venatoribacter sp.]